MDRSDLESFLEGFSSKNVCVIGDIMLDHTLLGKTSRISAEAPIPVVDVTHETFSPGGAANVAQNIQSLGATAYLIGVTGADKEASDLQEAIHQKKISHFYGVQDPSRRTTHKLRILSSTYQMSRADLESRELISLSIENQILNHFKSISHNIDALILEDYNKGLLTPTLISNLIDICQKKSIFISVDPKRDYFFDYQGVDLFKPNKKELFEAMGEYPSTFEEILILCKKSIKKLKSKQLLLTMSEEGMLLYLENGNYHHVSVKTQEIFDPSGAGDVAIATYILSYLLSLDSNLSLRLSNMAASISCTKSGVYSVHPRDFIENFDYFC